MQLEQIYFPQSGPDWGKIALVGLGLLAVGLITYKVLSAPKPYVAPKPANDDDPKKDNI